MKVQDLFKNADGSNILNKKITMVIHSLPDSPVQKQTKKGNTIDVFPVQLEKEGQLYDWELNASQMERIFTKTDRQTNAITWRAVAGDTVNVWFATPKGSGGFPYFAAEPTATGATVDTAAAAEEVFGDGPQHSSPPQNGAPNATIVGGKVVPIKPRFVPVSRGPKTEWDGTPRQSSFRQGLAGMIQAILSNPHINPTAAEDVEFAHQLAAAEVEHVRITAKILEEKIKE